ncbi:GAF domain-containing protein [Ureibacillus xyleni]|uniref:GAF domain-containing protein n=1 Tax=Ureibacillus xyleni TaxID=614648 RepID=A0A285T4X2_9BACL|nr:GAF domain-containing protein [Ureibacillus xyleni]SOC15833.1 GAF domain-containing protein [Ureibacillus xyleni]
MENNHIVVQMKKYMANKNVRELLSQINPFLNKKEDNIRVLLETMINSYITEEEFRVIEAKMKLGTLCLDLEKVIPTGFATLLFYVKEENKIYHGAAPNIPLHYFDFFYHVNEQQVFHEMVCGKAIAKKDFVYVDAMKEISHEKVLMQECGFKSLWSVPFFRDQTIIGTFAMYQTKKERPTTEQIQFVKQKVMEYQNSIFHISNKLARYKTKCESK